MRDRIGLPAMVAQQLAAEPVLNHRRSAIRTLHPMPAGAAEREWRIAAPVQEQQGLVTAGEGGAHGLIECRRNPAPRFQLGLTHVDQRGLGHFGQAVAAGQFQHRVAAAINIDQTFERRRRGGQHHWKFSDAAIEHRQIAGMVADTLILFVGALMLFIDHDQAEVGPRQKQRRAGADDDARFRRSDSTPDPLALARLNLRMPVGGLNPEPPLDPGQKLRGERNFGQQQQNLRAGGQGCRHRLEIDLSLARTGHAIEKHGASAWHCNARTKIGRRCGLFG